MFVFILQIGYFVIFEIFLNTESMLNLENLMLFKKRVPEDEP